MQGLEVGGPNRKLFRLPLVAACPQNVRPLLERKHMIPALEALQRLREGNRRFADDTRKSESLVSPGRRAELTAGQEPFAAILGCSDSRVPVEIVFDQGLGDLFVIRVAGNIVAPSQIGSVEFVAERFKTRLVVVLGHSRCGVIQATVEQLTGPTERRSRNVHSIVNRVRPSVEGLLETGLKYDYDALVHHAVRANVRASTNQLRHGSQVIEQLIQTEGLLVVGAEYSLETGLVEFFDGMPDEEGATWGEKL
jgi:carbonic anhydrase